MPVNPARMPAEAGELILARHCTHTTTELADMLGVSGSTVRAWARWMGVRCRVRSAARRPVRVAAHMARLRWIFEWR